MLFEKMIGVASKEIVKFTKQHVLSVERKSDKTVVTKCDKHIHRILTSLTKNKGLSVVSEESKMNLRVVKSGNYLIIDPIDGTLGYIKHVNQAITKKLDNPCIDPNFGSAYDYCLLIGIVENGKPRFGCCYNYVTEERIFLDSEGDVKQVGTPRKGFDAKYAQYVDRREMNSINEKISKDSSVITFTFGSLGIASLYTQLNNHDSAVIVHFAQQNGLWDILPACVAAEFTGATILDGFGEKIKFKDYLLIPGKGLVVYIGNKFSWVKRELKKQNR